MVVGLLRAAPPQRGEGERGFPGRLAGGDGPSTVPGSVSDAILEREVPRVVEVQDEHVRRRERRVPCSDGPVVQEVPSKLRLVVVLGDRLEVCAADHPRESLPRSDCSELTWWAMSASPSL